MKIAPEDLKVDRHQACATDLSEVRALLPGQCCLESRRLAEVEFGLSYTAQGLERKIRDTLPPPRRARWFKHGTRWSLQWIPLDIYTHPIPDSALMRFRDALKSGHFEAVRTKNSNPGWGDSIGYFVIDAKEVDDRIVRSADPWLVAKLKGPDPRYIVLAYWD